MRKVIPYTLATGLFNGLGAAAFVIDGNLAGIIAAIVSTIGLTLAVISWIDRRIEHKMRNAVSALEVRQYFRDQEIIRQISKLGELQGHPPIDMDRLLEKPPALKTGSDQ